MARYKIRREGGVIDRERGDAVVLPRKTDPAWRKYQAWRKAGNTPDAADAIAAPAPDLPTQDQLDVMAARQYPALAALARMSPAEVVDYINRNVTGLAGAKTAITTLAVAVSILARRI